MTSARRRASAAKGYTLIEVLVTVTVMGIAGTVVLPSLGSTGILRTQAAVRTIVADLTFAQSDALAYQRGRAVMFDVGANAYRIVEITGTELDPAADTLYDARGPGQRYVVELDDHDFGGAAIEAASFDADANLIFDPLGGPVMAPQSDVMSSGGQVVVSGQGGRFQINVAAFTGRVTVQRLP